MRSNGNADWERRWRALYDRCRDSSLSSEDDEMAYWDGLAQKYSELRAVNDFEFGRRVRDILWGDALGPGSVVLDVGAGPGSLLVPFARRAALVEAVARMEKTSRRYCCLVTPPAPEERVMTGSRGV